MCPRFLATVVCGVCALTAGGQGQSINIRFGTPATIPAATYGAAGLAGVWNAFEVTPANVRLPLVDLQGAPTAARFYQLGNSSMLTFDNPRTSGDDKKLMDSMILSTNSPIDGCFWVEGLLQGQYEVTIYAMTPDNPSLLNRTRVDNGTPGPVMVGGLWPGQHQPTVTFSRFTVTTTNGVIAFHDGLYGGVLQSGMNAVQLEFLPPGAARALNYGAGCYAVTPLTQSVSARPILGTTIQMVTHHIPATALVSIQLLSITQHNPGLDLTAAGMPGCFLYADADVTLPLPGSGTQSVQLPIPTDSSLRGALLYSQSASLVPGVNPLGALSSNGTLLRLGSL